MTGTLLQRDDASRQGSSDVGQQVAPAGPALAQLPQDRTNTRTALRVGLVGWLVAFVVLAAIIVGLGLLLTNVLLPNGLDVFDGSVSHWFVRQRTSTLDMVTRIGSDLGSTAVIIGVAVVAVIVLTLKRYWREIGFLVSALALEASVCLLASSVVDRTRPQVPRLDATPPTASYPSGHTAASIALYVGLALVIGSLVRSIAVRTAVWIVALVLPVFVGVSRLYRGMHHFTDIGASLLLGSFALLFALLVTRHAVEASIEEDGAATKARRDESVEVSS